MVFAASEGRLWRYEVCEHTDGYLVQMRDLETGELDEEFATLFRSMPVAFAFAEMSAAFDRYATAETDRVEDEDEDVAIDLEQRERTFIELCDRLGDNGIQGGAVRAWERESRTEARTVLH